MRGRVRKEVAILPPLPALRGSAGGRGGEPPTGRNRAEHIAVDTLFSAILGVGDLVDASCKANHRNVLLLQHYVD